MTHPNDSTDERACECGCGRTVRPGSRYLRGHQAGRVPSANDLGPNPAGLCLCGCGQRTEIARKSDANNGDVKGTSRKYIRGHSSQSGRAGYAICEQCGTSFRRHEGWPNRFCSRKCRLIPKAVEPDPVDPTISRVPLTRGYYALIDTVDAIAVGALPWSVHITQDGKTYARTTTQKVYLHRFILGVTDPRVKVDHQNGNGLDCRRSNIRRATNSLNIANSGKRPGRNPYKGVGAHGVRWVARITVNYKSTHLGTFDTAEEAARAYDTAARHHFGEFAGLNFPDN